MWDSWIKAEGMSKEEAMEKWLPYAKAVMDRYGHNYDNPNKAYADKQY